MYTNPQNVRDILGVTNEEAPDSVLDELIQRAQSVVIHYLQVEVKDEEVYPDSSGYIQLKNKFLADRNFDKKINEEDILVFGWKTSMPDSKVPLTISTIFPEDGILQITNTEEYEKYTVTYAYYTKAVDWDLVELATIYYTAMLWTARELFLVPEDFAIGNIRVRTRQPWEHWRNEFLRIIYHLIEIPISVVAYRKIVIPSRKPIGTYYGPGTTLEEEFE